MTTPADTLRAIEAYAERACKQELTAMTGETLSLRTYLQMEDKAYADGLLLKLDRLATTQVVRPACAADAVAFLMPSLNINECAPAEPKAYRVRFFDRMLGELEDVFTVDRFETAVQLVRDYLAPRPDHIVHASWSGHGGQMTVYSTRGTCVASVTRSDFNEPVPEACVAQACAALQAGARVNFAAVLAG
jgi:hypothetical protein